MSFSEKEAMLHYDRDFFTACLSLKKNKVNQKDIKTLLPEGAIFTVNRDEDLSIKYTCNNGEDFFSKDVDGIAEGGIKLLSEVTHPFTLKYTFPEFAHYGKFGNKHQPFVRFQRARSSKKHDFMVLRTTTVRHPESQQMLTMHNPIPKLKKSKSIRLHIDKEMEFVHRNYHKFYRLSNKEKELLVLLGEGIRPNHIAAQQLTSYANIRRQVKVINVKLELTKSTFNKAAIYAKYVIYFDL